MKKKKKNLNLLITCNNNGFIKIYLLPTLKVLVASYITSSVNTSNFFISNSLDGQLTCFIDNVLIKITCIKPFFYHLRPLVIPISEEFEPQIDEIKRLPNQKWNNFNQLHQFIK